MHEGALYLRSVNGALAELFAGNDETFALDDNGMVAIGFGDGIDVVLQAIPDTRTIMVWAELCRAAAGDSGTLARALKMNFFETSPTGARIACDDTGATLLLCHEAGEAALSAESLGAFLEAFVAGAAAARSELLNRPAAGSDDLATESVGEVMFRG